jgi:modulator of FtsH protease HflK
MWKTLWSPLRLIQSINRRVRGLPAVLASNDGPPDLDKVWQDFNRKLNAWFGGKKGNNAFGNSAGGGSGGAGPGAGAFAGVGVGVLAAVALMLWLASGFFILPEGQVAAILRFGEYKSLVDTAGFKWRLPYPIENHELVNKQQLRQVEIGYRGSVKTKQPKESLMLTGDQSIVDMQYAVQYRISNPAEYLFNNRADPVPEEIIRQAAETAMREVVGRTQIDKVLYEEKDVVAKNAQKSMQAIADRYKAGITVVDVTIQQAQPPEQVQNAFEDANKAAQDKERSINEGRAYANDVIPKAKGSAARLLLEAEGYKQRIIVSAEGDASRFNQVLTEYSKAPQVTRDRMYLETMQQIYANTTKVYVDSKAGSNLLYLPLDKLMQQTGSAPNAPVTIEGTRSAPPPEAPRADPKTDDRRDVRNRDR